MTWRLADALPQEKLAEWSAERDAWMKRHPQPWNEETRCDYHKMFSARIDEWLDAGHGSCVLRNPACGKIVANAFQHFGGQRYELGAFVVMPNHVHVLFRPLPGHPLETIIHSWKSFCAKQVNKILGRSGTLWQDDYWDRIVRNEARFNDYLGYIRDNPVKAKLPPGQYILMEANAE